MVIIHGHGHGLRPTFLGGAVGRVDTMAGFFTYPLVSPPPTVGIVPDMTLEIPKAKQHYYEKAF